MDLLQEEFEALVLRDPCADLREQVFGDVDGTGFAVLFAGEVLALMQGAAVVTAAGGAAAAVRVGGQGRGQERRGGGDFLEPRLEHAADERGMVGNAHGQRPGDWERRSAEQT